jgi:RimJ/RimL family protein N-acetyltransferase
VAEGQWLARDALGMSNPEARSYPRALNVTGGEVEVRRMTTADADGVLAFARELPEHDLLFLPRDITQPKVLSAWTHEIERGSIVTLLAVREREVHGCAAIVRDELSWSAHVGELRVVVSRQMRGKGLGRALIQECFALALSLGLEKLVAQMTVDQRGAIAVFESLGFRGEALLRNHVKDRAGATHDLVILSHDVPRFQAQMSAYGLPEAL